MMKKSLLAIGVVALSVMSAASYAQTCASPLPITSQGGPHDIVTADTCTATNELPTYGGTTSAQNEVIYSFVAQSANATIAIAQNSGFASSSAAIYLLPACTASTDPIAFGFPGTAMTVSGLTNGSTYYVVATADPGSAAGSCGNFTATVTGTLPVTLKKYSVD